MSKTVAIVGASSDRRKFGNKSLRAHRAQGWDVYPVNPNEETVEGLKCYPSVTDVPVNLDRISVYVPWYVGIGLLKEFKESGAKEVWLNPGSDSPELLQHAEELGLNVIRACSIIDVGMSPAQFPEH